MQEKEVGRRLLLAIEENWASDWLEILKDELVLEKYFPEFKDTILINGGQYHNETIFDHLLLSLKSANSCSVKLKLAILLHDIGKPATYKNYNNVVSFHKHEIVGATIAYNLCKRLNIDSDICRYVVKLIRYHMFYFPEGSSNKTICKWLFKVGKEDWRDLFKLREADRKGKLNKINKPVKTYEIKELENRINYMIDSRIVFKEDLHIADIEIKELIRQDIALNKIYCNLIGLVNYDISRNNSQWLRSYVKRIYG
jgi:putative nucleotidyltransferase with HDIG domain